MVGALLLPVPPAIIPRCLAVLVSAGDFLSGWTAKTPADQRVRHHVGQLKLNLDNKGWRHFCVLTFALVHKKAAGSSEVDGVIDLEALQVLTHLPARRKFWIDVFKVNLSVRRGRRDSLRKASWDAAETQTWLLCHLYLHHQVHEAFVIIAGHWRVRTHHQLPVNSCWQIDVLPCRGRHMLASDICSSLEKDLLLLKWWVMNYVDHQIMSEIINNIQNSCTVVWTVTHHVWLVQVSTRCYTLTWLV